MNRVVWIGLLVGILGIGGFWAISSNIEYAPEMVPRSLPRNITSAELQEVIEEVREEAIPSSEVNSQAVVERSEHDFGTIGSGQKLTHTFEIRNDGTAPLRLGDPVTTNCEANLSLREVPPGGSSSVKITSGTGSRTGIFDAVASVPTSDPNNPLAVFKLRGQVYKWIECDPVDIVVPAVPPGQEPQLRSGYVYSRYWDSFELGEITTEFIQWDVAPMSEEELAEKEALSGYRIDVRAPADSKDGTENRVIVTVPITPPEEYAQEAMVVHFAVYWKVFRRFSLYCSDFSTPGVIELGKIKPGTSKSSIVRLKVHDEFASLDHAILDVEPAFLKATIQPQGQKGNYVLKVEIPDDAPVCAHLRPDLTGKLHLITNDPLISNETLQLRFAVVGENPGY